MTRNDDMTGIRNYTDFLAALQAAGFSMAGGQAAGIYAVIPFSWNETPAWDTPVRWHTGHQDTDPWAWRMRVLAENRDIAYGKFFFRKGGYITRDWYPCFLAARRNGMDFASAYQAGLFSQTSRQIYRLISDQGRVPLHAIRPMTGLKGPVIEKALVDLQMGLFITICGEMQHVTPYGSTQGWPSTVLCTTEAFWGDDVFTEASSMTRQQAVRQITEQVLALNPGAAAARIERFIHASVSPI